MKNTRLIQIVGSGLILSFLGLGSCKKMMERFRGNHKVWIISVEAGKIAKFKTKGQKIQVEYNLRKDLIKGNTTKTGKRKYWIARNIKNRSDVPQDKLTLLAQSIPNPKGFKVRGPGGELLWKVNMDAEAIRISNNNKNQNPRTLKFRKDEIIVWLDKKKLGRVKMKNKKAVLIDATGKRRFLSREPGGYAVLGLLLFADIPEEQRYVIMSEIIVRKLGLYKPLEKPIKSETKGEQKKAPANSPGKK